MTRHRLIRLAAATSVLGLLVPAAAFAEATSGSTDVEFEVADFDGDLVIDVAVPDGGVAVLTPGGGGLLDPGGDGVVSGALPATTVYDSQGGLSSSWVVTVTGTDLEHADFGTEEGEYDMEQLRIPANRADVSVDLSATLDNVLNMELSTPGTGGDLGDGYTLISGTTLLGNGRATYTPEMTVDVPENTPGGKYSGTVTQTVS